MNLLLNKLRFLQKYVFRFRFEKSLRYAISQTCLTMSRVSIYVVSHNIYIDDEEDDDVNDLKIVENIRIQFEIFSCLRRLTTSAAIT